LILKRRETIVGALLGAVILGLPFVVKWRAERQRWRCFEALRESRSPLGVSQSAGSTTSRWVKADGTRGCEFF